MQLIFRVFLARKGVEDKPFFRVPSTYFTNIMIAWRQDQKCTYWEQYLELRQYKKCISFSR